MPVLPDAPFTVKVRLAGVNQGTTWNVGYHLQYTGVPPTVADLEIVANAAGAAWGTNIGPLSVIGCDLSTVVVVDLNSRTGNSTEVVYSNIGLRSGTPLPTSSACVASWHQSLRYRGGHPRTYFPVGTTTDTLNSHLWTPTFQTEAEDAFNAWRAQIVSIVGTAQTWSYVFVSYVSDGVLRPVPLILPITGVLVHGRMDTQRRRLGKETP
jgi:hypothetical protein